MSTAGVTRRDRGSAVPSDGEARARFPLLLAATGLAVVFCWSGTYHLANPYRFLEMVHQYRVLPVAVAPYVAAMLPFLQWSLAAGLLTPVFRRPALILSIALLAVFAGIQTVILYRGDVIECGCFPHYNAQAGWLPLGIDLVLIALALLGLYSDRMGGGKTLRQDVD